MSLSSIPTIQDRMASATKESRLALFRVGVRVDCFFADTIEGRKRMAADSDFLGTVDADTTRAELLGITGRGGS